MASAEKRGRGPRPWRARYLKPDGTYGSKPGFETRKKALTWGNDQEADIRNGRWIDPERGKISLADYFAKWQPAQDVSDSTRDRADSLFRNHLKPKWGDTPIREIHPLDVAAFDKDLRGRRSKSTAGGVMDLLRLMLADAVYAKMIDFLPVQPRQRRGKKSVDTSRKGIATTLEVVEAICARLPPSEALLVRTKAFSGMRWGEVAGLRRSFLMLMPATGDGPASGWYDIDAEVGAVHEDKSGHRYFGPPKDREARTVELPPFLVEQLLAHLEAMPRERDLLFVDSQGSAHRRSNFSRYRWRPACDGWPEREATRNHPGHVAAPPILTGLRPHDMRHTLETWLQEDGVRQVAIDERLGHVTPGMSGRYGHGTPVMRAQILAFLQRRWETIHAPAKS